MAESEVRYSALFANNCMPMMLMDPHDGRIVDANIRAVDFYGWDQATLTSMTVMDVNMLSLDEIRHEMSLAGSTGKTCFDFKHRLASGEIRDAEVFSAQVGIGGQTHLLSTVQDVTERRLTETRMKNVQALIQRLIDEMPSAAYLKDSEVQLVMVNKLLGQVVGKDPQTLIGKTAHEISPKEFADGERLLVD